MRVCIRGKAGNNLLFEDTLNFDEDLDAIEAMVQKHTPYLLANPLHVIEFEFLDEPDPLQRFFRLGTDRDHMVIPILINFND
jgi:hypothetical protein